MLRKKELPAAIYHRIYRLASKKVPVNKIALVLNLPFNTVKNVIDHFSFASKINHENVVSDTSANDTVQTQHDQQPYLDIYILQRLRFTIIDLNGMIVEHCIPILQPEISKILISDSKAVAILMANVIKLDDEGFNVLYAFYKEFLGKGRYSALLDPSKEVEQYIAKHNFEEKIPIFGTEKAFEDTAFKTRKK